MTNTNYLESKNILVVGDVMLDKYYNCDVLRISPEAPVPVLKKVSEKSVLGGAANVATNLIAANQLVAMLTIVGDDAEGDTLQNVIKGQGINVELIFKSNRRTTVKTRFIANNNQQVMRFDVEDDFDIDENECSKMIQALSEHISEFDLIVISDYMKGLLTYDFTQGVIDLATQKRIPVVIDVKDKNIDKYCGAYLLKPNLKELSMLTGMSIDTDDKVIEASQLLRQKCGCEYILTTLGAKGMIMVGDNQVYSVASLAKDVFDVTGAGDTAIAYLAASIANNIKIEEAMKISNIAAGYQVGKVGTSIVTLEEVFKGINYLVRDFKNKILDKPTLEVFREMNKGKKIVFTNGCFDILHVGHVRYLQKASKLGDMLVIGVNSDESVKRLKGEGRPINNIYDRIELLAALDCVSYVTVFEEDTPYELIKMIQPDVLVKGGDYKPEDVVGKDIVEARGGKLELIEFVEGKSTTGIIQRIKE